MKIYVCDANSDLSKIKPGQNDKLIFVTDSGKGEPMLPYSLFNMLRGTKVQVSVLPIERGQAGDIAFAMLYAAEKAKGNDVIISSNALNTPPATMEKIYNSVFADSKKPAKKKSLQPQSTPAQKPESSEQMELNLKAPQPADTNIIEKIPAKAKKAAKKASEEIKEQAAKVTEKVEKVAKRTKETTKEASVVYDEATDDIDAFMDKLASIDSFLVSHTKHIVDAARLAISENKPREEALKIISKTHGHKIYTLIKKSGKEDEIFNMAGKLKD